MKRYLVNLTKKIGMVRWLPILADIYKLCLLDKKKVDRFSQYNCKVSFFFGGKLFEVVVLKLRR